MADHCFPDCPSVYYSERWFWNTLFLVFCVQYVCSNHMFVLESYSCSSTLYSYQRLIRHIIFVLRPIHSLYLIFSLLCVHMTKIAPPSKCKFTPFLNLFTFAIAFTWRKNIREYFCIYVKILLHANRWIRLFSNGYFIALFHITPFWLHSVEYSFNYWKPYVWCLFFVFTFDYRSPSECSCLFYHAEYITSIF